jgi:hypothetical protein
MKIRGCPKVIVQRQCARAVVATVIVDQVQEGALFGIRAVVA